MSDDQSTSISRREFLHAGAATLAAHSLLSATAGAARPRPAGPFKVGLIGCGGRGTGAALQALGAGDDIVLHAMGDLFQDRLDSSIKHIEETLAPHPDENAKPTPAANSQDGQPQPATPPVMTPDRRHQLDCPAERRFVGVDAYQKVIDSGVDVVLLTTYPHFRPTHLKAAVDAGKHIFCEKPMAVDAPGLRAVRDAATLAAQKGLVLVSGFCWRYADAERATFAKLHEGLIGDVVSVHSTYHTTTLSKRPRKPEWSDMEFQLRNWWHFTWLSGDHVVEQAIHSVDRLAWAMNGALPARCVCLGGRAARSGPEHGDAFDHFSAIYEYADGRRAFMSTRQIDGCPSDNTDYIYARQGSCVINGWTPIHRFKDHAGNVLWDYSGPSKDMYQNEHDHLFRCLREGRTHNDGEWMCNSNMMALMARFAAYTGQTIEWEQAWNSQESLTPPSYEFGEAPPVIVPIPGKTKFV